MTQESLLDTNWSTGDEISAAELNNHGQEHLDLDGHGDGFHAVQYLKSLSGGNGITPNNINDGDTVSVNLPDIAGDNLTVDSTDGELDVTGTTGGTSLSGGNGVLPTSISDGDTVSVNLSDLAGANLTVDSTNSELDATDTTTSLGGGNGINPANISDGDTVSVSLADIAGNNLRANSTSGELDANDTTKSTSLSGGNGVLPTSISDGDTVSVNLSDLAGDNLTVDSANGELDADNTSGITSLSGGAGIDPPSISDGDTVSLTSDTVTVAGKSVSLGSSTDIAYTDLSDTSATFPLPNTDLLNSVVTVAGNTVSLGSSTSVAHSDLSNAPASAHHQEPTTGTGITDEGSNQFGVNLSAIAGNNLTVNSANDELDATDTTGISSLTGGDGVAPASISDGDTLSAAWGDAADLTSQGSLSADSVSAAELSVHPFSYDPGMQALAGGVTKEEANRIALQPKETLVIERLEIRQQGGGSANSSITLDVFNPAQSSVLGTVTLNNTKTDIGQSSTGATLTMRLSNSTQSTVDAAPRVQGYITNV